MTENLLDGKDDLPEVDLTKDYLTELVGENKKFKTVQDLARGKVEADRYIPHLEQRLDELREDYTKLRDESTSRASLQELVDRLSKQQPLTSSEQPDANEVLDRGKPPMDLKDVESLVSSKIREIETSKKQEENFNKVKAKLQERYGSNYKNVLKEQIEDLELTDADVNDLARNRPNVLIRTLGLDKPQSGEDFQSPVRSNQRNDSFAPKTQKRTWAYYQNLKKENPNLYRDPKTNVQMLKDMEALGAEFEDGNFHN